MGKTKELPESEIVSLYNFGISLKEIADNFNVTRKTIKSRLIKHGINIRTPNMTKYGREISKEVRNTILKEYHNKTSGQLSEELNVSKGFITKLWMENGLSGKPNRTYYCNEHYFDSIDSPDKAYYLGFLAADGCVHKRKELSNKMLSIKIAINDKDEELIDDFLKRIKSNQVKLYQEKKNVVEVAVNSDIMGNALIKWGITPRKTWTYVPIRLDSEELTWHYIRGYFDGDGSISFTPRGGWTFGICGNEATINWFQNFFVDRGFASYISEDTRDKYTNKFMNIRIRRRKHLLRLMHKLYSDSDNIRLSRKYERFKTLKKECENSKTKNMWKD